VAALAKGWLTEDERRALLEYESRLFESSWTLRPEDLPRFQPDKGGERVGTVSEPKLEPSEHR